MTGTSRLLFVLVVAQLLIFLFSLPGLGVETRKSTDYAAWAGPIFLVLTVLVFLLGIASLRSFRSRISRGTALAAGQALAAVTTNGLDFSHVGGPAPPTGPLILGVISIIVAVLELGLAWMLVRSAGHPMGPA